METMSRWSRYKSKDQLQSQATTYKSESLKRECSGRRVLIANMMNHINMLIGETETQIKIKLLYETFIHNKTETTEIQKYLFLRTKIHFVNQGNTGINTRNNWGQYYYHSIHHMLTLKQENVSPNIDY